MSSRRLRVWVLIGVAVVLAAVGWRLATDSGTFPAGLGPDAARIERLRRKGDVDALAREAMSSDAQVACLAVQALGRLGPEAAPHIEPVVRDTRVEVREKAVIALGQAGGRGHAASLAACARGDRSANVRAAAVTALGQARAYNEMETLLAALEDENRTIRHRAAAAIIRITGIDFGFRADDPPERRRKAVVRMCTMWPRMEPFVRHYHAARSD